MLLKGKIKGLLPLVLEPVFKALMDNNSKNDADLTNQLLQKIIFNNPDIQGFLNGYQRRYFLENLVPFNVRQYNQGDSLDWHDDLFNEKQVNLLTNRYALVVILQASEKGGILEFKHYDTPMLKESDFVIFNTKIIHRVTKVEQGTRISLITYI